MGYFRDEGLEVSILAPSETSDALKLAASGKATWPSAIPRSLSFPPHWGSPSPSLASRGAPLSTLLFLEGKGIKKPSYLAGQEDRSYRSRRV